MPLIPLTARVLCVIFILFTVYLVILSADPWWSAARVNVESFVIALTLIVVGVIRTRDTILWSRPSAWLFLTGVVAALAITVVSLVRNARPQVDAADTACRCQSRSQPATESGASHIGKR
jgi:hypothetical protein